MSRRRPSLDRCHVRFPRVSGDEPMAAITEPREGGFSPRERG